MGPVCAQSATRPTACTGHQQPEQGRTEGWSSPARVPAAGRSTGPGRDGVGGWAPVNTGEGIALLALVQMPAQAGE